MIRIQFKFAIHTLEAGLRLSILRVDSPALVAGLAGVPGIHGHQLPALVGQALLQLAPVAGQDPAVQARFGLDVGAGLRPCAPRRLRHRLGVEIFDHQGMGLVRQLPADVVRVVGADARLLLLKLAELTPQAPAAPGASALARLVPLLAPDLGLQLTLIRQAVDVAATVCDLAYIAVQTQHAYRRALGHTGCRHGVSDIGIPLGPGARALLADAHLPGRTVGIQVAPLHTQPAEARHVQLVIPQLHCAGKGEPVLSAVSALEAGVSAPALKEGLVGVSQVFQDIADLAEAVRLQPRVPGILPQGCELLAQTEKCEIGFRLLRTNLVVLPTPIVSVLPLFQGQKVIPHKAAGARGAGHLLGLLPAARQQPHPHTAVHHF